MVGGQLPHHPQEAPALSEEDKLHCTQVSRLDRHVGELTAHLEELGLDSNTLVLVTSDNGRTEEGGTDPDTYDANGPLRGYKRNLYEGGTGRR